MNDPVAMLAERPLTRLANYRGSFDVAPVTLIARSTVEAIAERQARIGAQRAGA